MNIPSQNSYECLSGSVLKVIAAVSMLIDHFAATILAYDPQAFVPYFYFLDTPIGLYRLFRDFGRLAFPIFCFLLTEGFVHTKSRIRYARNLLFFALLSEIPFSIVMNDLGDFQKQNTLFTLLLGFLALWALERFVTNVWLQILCVVSAIVGRLSLSHRLRLAGCPFDFNLLSVSLLPKQSGDSGRTLLVLGMESLFRDDSHPHVQWPERLFEGKSGKIFFLFFYLQFVK